MSEITQLLIPHEKIRNFLLKSETLKIDKDGNWKAKARNRLLNNEPLEIVTTYNSEIRGFYNYYSMANNISNLHSAFGIFKHLNIALLRL